MQTHNRAASAWMVTVACLAGLGCRAAPSELLQTLRNTVRDALRPGQAVWRSLSAAAQSVSAISPISLDRGYDGLLRAKLSVAERNTRRLMVENARLRQELCRRPPNDGGDRSTPELLQADFVVARVLGEETADLWRSGKLLDAGATAGLRENSLVLGSPHPLVDQGQDAGLAPDQPAYSGRIVVGRIAAVGRWSSSLQLVTSPGFTGRARIARNTADGVVFGGEAVIEGVGGPICRVLHVRAEEPVSAGDLVFTGGGDGVLPYPMFYGTVVRAELPPGRLEWVIEVAPALDRESLQTVQVLRTRLNPLRLAAQ